MIESDSFTKECARHCPELQKCVSELALRKIIEHPDITLGDIIMEKQESGLLPERCIEGPQWRGVGQRSSGSTREEDILVTSLVKTDRWGDPVSVRCSSESHITLRNSAIKRVN